jgi:hypothetical protein
MIVYYILAIYNSHMVEPTKRKWHIFLEYLGPTNNNSIFAENIIKANLGERTDAFKLLKEY